MKFNFKIKEYKSGEIEERFVSLNAEDKLSAFKLINEMYPRENGYSHSLIFNDEVCG